ncbi:MAG TPA: Gfo/Idh/MocA family oxidoreductase [Elusimicrobiota bacterium]|nr:Gfo/Idh/MocA family oxidoreductase [Elusimicrobiota bacterium]
MKKTLRVGIIGLGVGERHLAAYRKLRACSVVALCDRAKAKRAWAEKKYPKVRVSSRADELLNDKDVDLVSIASFDDDHFEQVLKALRAGKHVFVEKPLCRSRAELRAVKREWTKSRGRLELGSNLVLRAAPLYRWLKKAIAAGEFGRIYAVDGEYLYGRLEKITAGWRRRVKGYSVMLGGGIHLIDLFLWLTGDRPEKVLSTGNSICTEGTPFRYNDYVAATFRTASGLVGRITANFGCVHPHQHVLRIFGTKKTFIYDDAGPRLFSSRSPEERPLRIALSPHPKSKGDLIPEFVSAVLKGGGRRFPAQSFFDGISVAAAFDESLKSKTWEKVRYV